MSDNQYDNLSVNVNVGKQKFVKSIASNRQGKQVSHCDMLSVASVISQGSKLPIYNTIHNEAKKNNTMSNFEESPHKIKESQSQSHLVNTQQQKLQPYIPAESVKETRKVEKIELDKDISKIMAKAKKKMIDVYLK